MLIAAAITIALGIDAASLTHDLETIASSVAGVAGVHAELLGSGTSASLRGDQRFPMQSVYKVPIAMAVLDLVAHGSLALSQRVRIERRDLVPDVHSPIRDAHPDGSIDFSIQDLLRAAIVDSDGTASDILYGLAGGPQRITAYLRGIGIRGMTVAATERAMAADQMVQYRNFSTPHAAAALIAAIQAGRGVTPAHRDLLLGWMRETETGRNRIRAGAPPHAVVADKTGTDTTRGGLTRATNDIALVTLDDGRYVAIAIFIKDSTADQTAREAVIARMAAAVLTAWSQRASR